MERRIPAQHEKEKELMYDDDLVGNGNVNNSNTFTFTHAKMSKTMANYSKKKTRKLGSVTKGNKVILAWKHALVGDLK